MYMYNDRNSITSWHKIIEMLNKIIRIREKYLKPFNCVQTKNSSVSFKNAINKNILTNHL